MNISDILRKQIDLDESIGFPVRFSSTTEMYDQLTKDLVGLYGEIGEFSNIVKKITIKLAKKEKYELELDDAENRLKEEFIDSFIYILRIAAILNIDIEKEVLAKIQANDQRYESLRD
jgi:NTP pyrophosphatase (non-canonical NTP hydrolase)